MPTEYNYDDQGQFFPYFVLTLASLITLPVTYSLLNPSKELENTAPRIRSEFKPQHADLIEGQRRKQRRRERRLKRMLLAIVGWLMIAWMIYLMAVTAKLIPQIWDPYDVLGVSRSADEKQIKSHYRRLSLTQHPDKVKLDAAKNITTESANARWVEITKAFKALTDEEIRNNYLQYGHPDGKQSFSIGIALPSSIVTERNGKYVLMLYGLLLGVMLPYFVGRWWYGTQRMTKDKVLVASAGNLFREYDDEMAESEVIGALSSGEEFAGVLKGPKAQAGLEDIEKSLPAQDETTLSSIGISSKDLEKLKSMEGVRKKALGLLWAYLGRVDLKNQTLDDEKYEIAPIALALNESFTSIALAYGNTEPVLAAYHASQSIIQAIAPNASPLLQLPYFTSKIVRQLEGENARIHMGVQDFMRMSADSRRKKLIDSGLLTNRQYEVATSVALQMPLLHVEKAFFKVVGERVITPSSLVNFVVKARFIPPGSTKVPEVSEADLEDNDPPEGYMGGLQGRKIKGRAIAGGKLPDDSSEERIRPPTAHAPYFARDHSPRWHVFLGDSKQGKIAVPPFKFSTFDKPIFDEKGNPTFNVQTLRMQFQAPPQVGRYTFVMHLVCDSYIGMDTKMDVTLVIEAMAKAEEIQEDEEISEPEEDTMAGQMNALKSGGITAQSQKKKKSMPRDESSDESDTEGEVESESETDTDTDTDDE